MAICTSVRLCGQDFGGKALDFVALVYVLENKQ
jgi:hypothetical protein